jgi:serine/threonine protein kinase
LIRSVGRGGFGEVWLASNRTTGHLRAVKVIPANRPDAVDAAGRESASLARLEPRLLRHPNLLAILHVGRTTDDLFYVMEPADDVSGGPASRDPGYRPASLESRLAEGPLTPEQRERYACQLLEGLSRLHEAGMVHRDVKPANCLFVEGDLKLADFGLVTEAGPLVSRVGTQKYMPPDGRMDSRGDVYAAGLLLYEMISGLPADCFPRLGERADEVVRSPLLSALMRIVLRACQPDPQDRFRDARQMLGELTSCRNEAAPPPARRRWTMAGFAMTILLLVAMLAWRATRPPLVNVNFVTYPFEATIYLDGVLVVDANGKARTTPCSVEGLPARAHQVVFRHERWGNLEMGHFDFARRRQIVGHWSSGP